MSEIQSNNRNAAQNDLQRFLACMEYEPAMRPNHELGVWAQTKQRWQEESADAVDSFTWSWFDGEEDLALDRREYIPVKYGFIPHFEYELLEEDDVGPSCRAVERDPWKIELVTDRAGESTKGGFHNFCLAVTGNRWLTRKRFVFEIHVDDLSIRADPCVFVLHQ